MVRLYCDNEDCKKDLTNEKACYQIITRKRPVEDIIKNRKDSEDLVSTFFSSFGGVEISNIEIVLCGKCYEKFCDALTNVLN